MKFQTIKALNEAIHVQAYILLLYLLLCYTLCCIVIFYNNELLQIIMLYLSVLILQVLI